jgi:hypothetical protein
VKKKLMTFYKYIISPDIAGTTPALQAIFRRFYEK